MRRRVLGGQAVLSRSLHDETSSVLMEIVMFGFRGGESESTVARKIGYRGDAKARWSCLTTLDLSQIKNEEQLITLVKVRYSLPYPQAKADVESWMRGKEF
jgi:hypothetical protein